MDERDRVRQVAENWHAYQTHRRKHLTLAEAAEAVEEVNRPAGEAARRDRKTR